MVVGRCLFAALVLTSMSADVASVFGQSRGSPETLSHDEQEIYDAVISNWLGRGTQRQYVNFRLSASPTTTDPEYAECTHNLDFASNAGSENRKSLSGARFQRKGVELVDGEQWKPVDPGQSISEGKSVKAAVKEGFSHSLMSFSQIAFSLDRRDALVKFGMACGALCGSGSTMHLRKSGEHWKVLGSCGGGWIS